VRPGLIHEAERAPDDGVDQRADALDGDAHDVAAGQGERQFGHQRRPGGQDHPVREHVGPVQVTGQLAERAVQPGRRGRSGPDLSAVPADDQPDREAVRVGHLPGRADHRAQRAAAQVDLGLRQVQRVLALDRARAHVVAHRIAADLARGVEDQGQLGLGHVDGRVGAHRDGLARAGHPPGGRLEEQLRPFGLVDQRVQPPGALALLHALTLRQLVRHPGRPDLRPAVNGSQ
jgi:hypothetical protein